MIGNVLAHNEVIVSLSRTGTGELVSGKANELQRPVAFEGDGAIFELEERM